MKKVNVINKFVAQCTNAEGGKSQAKVHEAAQLFKIANKKLGGKLYELIENYFALPEGVEPKNITNGTT